VLPSSGVSSLTQLAPAACSVTAVFLWGAADFAGGYGSRRANAFVLTAFSHLCAFALMFAIALSRQGIFPSRASIAWALLAGAVGGFSLSLFYGALAAGQMGVTAPIAALVGAVIPTMVDIALEGAPSRWTICGFVLAVVAIWLITRPESSNNESSPNESAENDLSIDESSARKDASGRPAGVAMAALAGVGFIKPAARPFGSPPSPASAPSLPRPSRCS
jgi:drug/metabolite transporter (DMT)-like permease